MRTTLHDLGNRQLDAALSPWRALRPTQLTGRCLQAIRQALGLTTRQLAQRVGVSQSAVVAAERSEAGQDITLATLRRYANAMDCELVYALVPRRSLQETIEAQAERVAREEVSRVGQSMALEDQATSKPFAERQVSQLKRKLLEGRLSRLWR
jgi:predicted DNA-binding mobile mystery protein A